MSETLHKEQLINAVSEKAGESAAATGRIIDELFNVIGDTVAEGGKVAITGWVTFERGHRAARQGVNPRTGEKIQIAATHTAKVKVGSKLKDRAKSGN